MKKEDFHKGQTVYLLLLCNAARGKHGEELIREATVTAIGNKYITVSPGYYSTNVRFEIENNFREHSDYSPEHKLFLSREEIVDRLEKEKLLCWFRDSFRIFSQSKDFSLTALREAKEILEKSEVEA
ncbi:hypothetical protein [Lacrimispora sp.]|uniref:beta barrel domain-containing protein n=1 Tax=Lacrimispora sp. TaxID=2719234 RepID=UPI00399617ED